MRHLAVGLLVGAAGVVAGPGCGRIDPPPAGEREVPYPINMTLPEEVRIHAFTGTRVFDEEGGLKGIEVRIEARDAFGDATKAFGDFRFELYSHRAHHADHKGTRLAVWDVKLVEPDANFLHWDDNFRTYKFKLQWDQPVPVGREMVLVAVFSSDFTQRLIAERVFVAGQ